MRLPFRITTYAVGLIAFSSSSYGVGDSTGHEGFAISLRGSGEVILADEHIASYDWDEHRIVLTASGVERWQSFVEFNNSFDPPIRQLSELHTKEFIVMIEGVEMYRGHFSSVVSSLFISVVSLYDCLGVPENAVTLTFAGLNGSSIEDPRSRSEIEAHFRKQGKLANDE